MIQRIYIYVLNSINFPICKESNIDVLLLHASNTSCLRQKEGITDSFLFIVYGKEEIHNLDVLIKSYGFPNCETIFIYGENEYLDFDYYEQISWDIEDWLRKKHPGAIIDLTGKCEYESDNFLYWLGMETKYDIDTICNIDIMKFGDTLPDTHKDKAGTWLAILKEALELNKPNDLIDENNFAIYAATLCEWLHGFEVASGNSYNYFDAEQVIDALKIDECYLGYMVSEIKKVELKDLLCDYDHNTGTLSSYVLQYIIEDIRPKIIDALSSHFFHSDTCFFCTLYFSIWPSFRQNWIDYCCNLVGLETIEYGEIHEAWEYIKGLG